MGFLKNIRDSIYSPAFYSSIPQKSSSQALGYFLLISLIVTLLGSGPIIISFITSGQKEIEKFVSQASTAYPNDLTVTIENGQVTTNVTEPYFIPLPTSKTERLTNILVIDTKTPFSQTQFKKYNTAIWVTKDGVYSRSNSQSEVRSYDLSDVKHLVINRTVVNNLISKITPWLKLLTPLVIILIILGVFMLHMFRLLYLLFLALLIVLLTKLMKKPLSYGAAYKVGLYAMTLPLIVEVFAHVSLYFQIPFLFTIISLVIVFLNLRNGSVVQIPQTSTTNTSVKQ